MTKIKKHKFIVFMVVILAVFALVITIPSLAKLKNRNTIYSVSSWDGSIATSYKKGDGTKENPYAISNGAEFAFFIEQLKTIDYEGKYFELSNDIIINSGIFSYDDSQKLKYTIDDTEYYVKEYTNEYYKNESMEESSVGTLNSISPISNFKGILNGNSFAIFGLYITDSLNEDLALFKNLEGNINDLYIKNSLTYGIGDVAGIAVNAKGATLKNVVFDGTVVNKSLLKTSETIVEPKSINAGLEETTELLEIPNVNVEGGIKSIKLTGEYNASSNISINTIKVNGQEVSENSFEVDLTTSQLKEIQLTVKTDTIGTTINFSNLKYIVQYYDDVTAGVISNSTTTTITNVINKADVHGNYISAGFVGKSNDSLKITQSYNTGKITGQYVSSGIIGIIKNNLNHTTISNVYNKGEITGSNSGAIIGIAQDNIGLIDVGKSFNISSNYAINTILNSTINIVDCYSVNGLSSYSGLTNELFNPIAIENLYTPTILSQISYNEFVSFEDAEANTSNVWIYENSSLPILYIDDLNNPIANINLSKYSWNNLSTELDVIKLDAISTFSIDDVSPINPIKEKYYYITNSKVPMSKTELDNLNQWVLYDSAVTIKESGYYVVYAKIVDTEGRITYINTDLLAINLSGFQTKITMDDFVWEQYKTGLEDIYVNKDINLTIYAHDDLTPINSVEYYVSSKELPIDELNAITTWTSYVNSVVINEKGKYVVYAKITDIEGNITYINTDYILYGGYKSSLEIGNSGKKYNTNYITNKSAIKLTFESDFELEYKENYTHNLISNILLPIGTKITLIDKNTNKVYSKTIETEEDLYGYNNSCDGISNCSKYATYKFGIFEELGVSNFSYYNEENNYNKTIKNEKYVIIIDFKNTNLVDNYYDLSFYLAIKSEDNKYLYKTLDNTISNINVYSTIMDNEINTAHMINSDYNNGVIYYNSNSELNINLTNVLTYSMTNNKNIIDTNYESKKSGLLIKLYDEDGTIVNKNYLDNMIFEVGDKEFFASNDNAIRVNLGRVTDDGVKTLKIKTKENSSDLIKGTYILKISKYISNDGYYYDSLYDDVIEIPLVVDVENVIIPNYSFGVELTTNSIMLNKKSDNHLASFNVVYSGSFVEPNIRVSLYEKNELTAYNQMYTLINLQEYSSDTLTIADANKYFVDVLNPTFNLNLIPNKFKNNGYKYVFELYDGTRKISQIEKYFIVK